MANLPTNYKEVERLLNLKDDSDLVLLDEITSVKDRLDQLENRFSDKLTKLTEEVKKKSAEEVAFEIDPESIRGPEGKPGSQGLQGPQGKPGKDGKDGSQGPQGQAGRDGTNATVDTEAILVDVLSQIQYDSPEEVVQKVNVSKDKIKASQIEGLPEIERLTKLNNFDVRIGVSKTELVALQNRVRVLESTTSSGSGISASSVQDVSSQCDGVNKTFTVTAGKTPLMVFGTQFPNFYRLTTDFTSASGSFTLTSAVAAPEAGQTLITLCS